MLRIHLHTVFVRRFQSTLFSESPETPAQTYIPQPRLLGPNSRHGRNNTRESIFPTGQGRIGLCRDQVSKAKATKRKFPADDIDGFLLKIPAFGPLYEVWFRKDTYYRQDTRLVYLETIPRLVQKIIEDITAKDGVKLVNHYERAPILGELYKRRVKPE